MNLRIVSNGLKMLVNLSKKGFNFRISNRKGEVIDRICQDDIIHSLQEMNITSNKTLRVDCRALLDIVRKGEYFKTNTKVKGGLEVDAWESLFLQWYPQWENNQALCI